jgi:hypothetical protein
LPFKLNPGNDATTLSTTTLDITALSIAIKDATLCITKLKATIRYSKLNITTLSIAIKMKLSV